MKSVLLSMFLFFISPGVPGQAPAEMRAREVVGVINSGDRAAIKKYVDDNFAGQIKSIPMDAFRDYLPRITTPYTCWVDNDTFVTPGWMNQLVKGAEEEGMRAILPLTFEREGLDVNEHGESAYHT